jgi:hypothetical protein
VKVPNGIADREQFVKDVLAVCLASKEDRIAAYRTLKQYYLYGQETGTQTDANIFGTINKIYPHIDKQCSLLYSADNTRFSVEIGRSVPRQELPKAEVLTDAVMDRWHNCNADNLFTEALRWSHVYGSTFIKTRPKGQDIVLDLIEPHHFGVYREDICGLDNQEAYYHEYRITLTDLAWQLRLAGYPDPQIKQIVSSAADSPMSEDSSSVTQPVDRIVTSSALPVAQGEVNTFIGARIGYVPNTAQPMARMYELYVWNDHIEDYFVITCAHPGVPVYERPMKEMFLEQEVNFIQICPFPMHGYFWGMAPVERLLNLQMLRNTRWDQVQHLMEMQAHPASFGSGSMQGAADEMQSALDTPASLVLGDPGSDMKRLEIKMPEDLFGEVNYIDEQFDDAVGTSDQMSGRGEPGVRSEGHATQLMRVGASRTKQRALIVERQLEELATLLLQIMKEYEDRQYTAEDVDGKPIIFTAAQFTDEFMVRVDSHSSSPVFQQDIGNLLLALFKAKAIDREALIKMLPGLPMRDLLLATLKTKIEPAEARAAATQQKLALITGKKPAAGKGK